MGAGIIGCGNISESYLRLAPMFHPVEIVACADVNEDAAKIRADTFGIRGLGVAELLGADDVEIIVNLTPPAAHFDVSAMALEHGKHVYSEKPFVLSRAQGEQLLDLAQARGLRLGSAPDTFLGGAHQLARHVIDRRMIGRITSGTCHVMSHGMEHWHPNPDFFFKPGGGPVLDVGPYYIANLIQLIGPVKRVAAISATPATERVITSQPRHSEKITVETPTTIHAVMKFATGAVVTLGASWDVWDHRHSPMELYGETGSLLVPDPNFFGGEPVCITSDGDPVPLPPWDHPLGIANEAHPMGMRANYRAAGLAEMAQAIMQNRPHRCAGEIALHGIDVMTGILASAQSSEFVGLKTTCTRPAALAMDDARALLNRA